MIMWLIRKLPPEAAHNLAIWSLHSGFWRIGLVIDAAITLLWSYPLCAILKHVEKTVKQRK